MAELTALNSQTHRDLRIDVGRAYLELGAASIVGVVPREFHRLMAHYPILFVKSEAGQLEPAVLLGFSQGENLFISASEWDAGYLPLHIRRQPFGLVQREADAAAGTPASLELGLDLGSPYVQSLHGERLFGDDGQPAALLLNVNEIMKALVTGAREASAFVEKLTQLNLLEPVRIDIELIDARATKLEGFYWISSAVLKALPAAQFLELRDLDYLEWIYFQTASLVHVAGLVARKNKRLLAVARPAGDPPGNAAQT